MNKLIGNSAICGLRSVIRFLNIRNTKSADIHRQICEVHGENATSDSMVRKRARLIKKRRCAIQNRRQGMLSHGIVFIVFTANATQQLLMDFDWEQLNYPPTG